MHVEPLARGHDHALFRCGNVELDNWFRHRAGQASLRSESARTFVLVEDDRVVGYYSLAFGVAADESPEELLRGQPRYPVVPAVLLARLAIDLSRQGEGLGTRLLADALRRVIATTEHVAVLLVVVDAVDERAAAFYERHGFTPAPAPAGGRRRLVARVKDLRRSLGA